MFTIITLIDDELVDKYYHRHLFYMYRGFDRLFRVVDIRTYRADENPAEVTILDRFAMFGVMFYEGVAYESILNQLAGTKNLVFMTTDLHCWSILPHSIEAGLLTVEQLTPSINNYEQIFEMFDRLGIRHLISSYDCPELKIIQSQRPDLQTYVVELHIDPDVFKDYEMTKEYDLIIYGSTLPSAYPFRHRVCELMTQSRDFKVLHIEWDPFYNTDNCDEGLARKINRAWLGLATVSNFEYLLGKYFEIPACRTVVLGNMNEQGRKIFDNRYIHINNQMSDSQILNIVTDALADRPRLQQYADEMYNVMHANYTLAENERKLFEIASRIARQS